MTTHRPVKAERRYRVLLRLLPRSFRQEAEQQLIEVFRAEYEACSQQGRLRRLGCLAALWTRLLFDLLLTAAAVHSHNLCRCLRLASRHSSSRFPESTIMSRILQDLRYASRSLRRTPGFTLAAVLTLALGIGANAAVFSVVHELLFRAPPHLQHPERLKRLVRTKGGEVRTAFAYPDFAHYRDHNEAFQSMTGYDPSGLALTVSKDGETLPASGMLVSREYFEVLGARPAAGRWFLPEEGRRPLAHPVTVISHPLYQRLLGGRPEALPASLTLNGHPFTVIGAAPPGFAGASPLEPPPDLWAPLMMQPLLAPSGEWTLRRVPGHTWNWITVLGRLKPGISREAAQANIDAMAAHLAENFAEWNTDTGALVLGSYRFIPRARDSVMSMSRLLTGAVVILLLIACVNVAVLMLARASARRQDVGIRMALGAGRWRVLRLSLLESLLLALGGGLLGVLLAHWTTGLARTLLPFDVPSFAGPGLAVLAASLALAAVTALLAALIPSLHTSRLDAFSALRAQQGLDGGGRLRRGLVIAQVALSLVLICSAVLLARSLHAARSVDLGFQTQNRLLMRLNMRFHGYQSERGRAFITQALQDLEQHPAVLTASASAMTPFRGVWNRDVLPDNRREALLQQPGGRLSDVRMAPGTNAVAPGYFQAMGIEVRGRGFTDQDTVESPPAVIVNEAFAKTVWPDGEAIGRGLYFEAHLPPARVIGVARDARYYGLEGETQHQVYWPLSQQYEPAFSLLLHTRTLTPELVDGLRRQVLEIDPSLAFQSVRTLQEVVDAQTAQYRTSAAAVTVFALLALALAAVGLYGVESYLVPK